jgi:hypothetical protein
MLFVMLGCLVLPYAAKAQKLEDFEDAEALAKKGFFSTYFKGLFKGFFIVDPIWDMGGGVSLNMRSYSALGTTPRQDPFFYSLGANVNIRLWKVQLPISIAIAAKNTEASYPNPKELIAAFKNDVESQKKNFIRMGMSPRYKWIKLHFGNRNMTFSQFTLTNLTYLGAGTELTPGKFRFSGMYGRLAKAVPINLSLASPNLPVFSRKAYALKAGYGTQDEFFDLCYLNSKDDPNSIYLPPDSPTKISPESNEAIAFVGQKTFFKKLKLKLDIGSSAISPNELDASGKTLFPHSLTYTARRTSLFKYAMDNTLDFQTEKFTVGIEQKRIDPGYKSHGAYFTNSDIQDISLKNSFGLFKGAVHFNLSGGFQQDNLDKAKATTTTRLITTDNINFSKGAFTIDFNYNNNSSNVAYLLSNKLDSLNVIVVSQDAGVNFTWSKADKKQNQHALNISLDRQQVSDNVNDPSASAASRMLVGNLVYTYALSKTGWSFSSKGSFNQNKLAGMVMNRFGAGFGVNKNFLEGKITTGFDLNYLLTKTAGAPNTDNLTGGLKASWNITGNQSINLAWNYLSNRTLAATLAKTGEVVGTLGYQYNFSKPKFGKKKKPEAPAETPAPAAAPAATPAEPKN